MASKNMWDIAWSIWRGEGRPVGFHPEQPEQPRQEPQQSDAASESQQQQPQNQ
jgi:hypothetical protein